MMVTSMATPLDIAIENGRKEIAELLEKNGGIRIFHQKVWSAAYNGDIESVKGHLELGMDADAKDGNGAIPDSDFFVKLYNVSHIEILHMQSGTPLYYAALRGHEDIVKLLIDKGADVNANIGDDLSPQSILAAASFNLPEETPKVKNEKKEIFNFLVKNGAKSKKLLIKKR